jgi:hypothetical protein
MQNPSETHDTAVVQPDAQSGVIGGASSDHTPPECRSISVSLFGSVPTATHTPGGTHETPSREF